MSDDRAPRRHIPTPLPGEKDPKGAFVPVPPMDLSIDGLLLKGLEAIHGVMNACLRESKSGAPSREAVSNLKDCMAMLKSLKDAEDELLDDLNDEELEKHASKT